MAATKSKTSVPSSKKVVKTPIQKLYGCMKGKISYESNKIFNLD